MRDVQVSNIDSRDQLQMEQMERRLYGGDAGVSLKVNVHAGELTFDPIVSAKLSARYLDIGI